MNYYNEYDPKTAAWLRELIKAGAIPDGDVDERSIAEVKSDDLCGYTQCHFFAGIGGWSLALQLAGWPSDRPVWTGSCPCQPFSTAGKGLAQKDERHLWPVFFELIRQCRPEHVFGEQVASAIGHGWLDGVSADLEAEGYACGATVLGAHSVGAPHQRQRLYWVAHSSSTRGRSLRSNPLERDGRSAQIWEAKGSDGSVQGCAPCRVAKSERSGLEGSAVSEMGRSSIFTEDSRLDDTRRPSNERRGELGNVGRSAGEEQGEARQRQRGGDADSDSVQDDCGGLPITSGERWERGQGSEKGSLDNGSNAKREQGYDGVVGALQAGFWSDFQLVHCRDGKTRRVPTEPAFFPLAHGIPARVVRLRGYGNAIVPQTAAEFVSAYLETL